MCNVGFRLKRVSPLLLGLLFGFMQMAGTALAGDPGSYVPGPTPKPYPLLYCAEPAYTYGTQGMNGRIWTGRFLQYCEANGIPADTRGFEQIGEHETYGRQYRLMVGGAALYVQLRDDVLVSFLLEMDDEAMTTRQMEETLLHYYPLVMRACVYASLQGAGTGFYRLPPTVVVFS